MRENPTTDRKAAFEKLVATAGGKLVGFYFTATEGPGALTIFDTDPVSAAAITGTVASSEAVRDVKMMRLWSNDEAKTVRAKRAELHAAYKAPGQ